MASDLSRADRLRRRRHARETRFRWYGRMALLLAALALVTLVGSVGSKAGQPLNQSEIRVPVTYQQAIIDPDNQRDTDQMRRARYTSIIRDGLQELIPAAQDRQARRELGGLVSRGAEDKLRRAVLGDAGIIGSSEELWLLASDEVDLIVKELVRADAEPAVRRLSDQQMGWLRKLEEQGRVRTAFNSTFFSYADSREPEMAGMLGAIAGSLMTMLICLLASFPLAVMTAVYLEEFAVKNRWTDFIEININNLAAVPSIIFGLLGLALYLQFFGMPRSAPLVGGLTLGLMILPVIIISTRASLRSVPQSIRDAARGLGASSLQVVLHHVLPLAMPGIMTGTILGVARAIGETAPLLLIGMVAFVADVPRGFTDPATVMPVQVYLWADSPELAFVNRTALCILILLGFMILMNAAAIWIRSKFERRW